MSQTDEEKEIRLRDQFAIAAMQALLGRYKQKITLNENGSTNNSASQGFISSSNTYLVTTEYESETDIDYIKRIESKIELISHLAYKIADQMRKARLATFL